MPPITSLWLTTGPLPVILGVLAPLTLAVTLARRGPRWTRRVLWCGGAAAVATVAVAAWVELLQPFDFTYPAVFYVWAGAAVFAVAVAAMGWAGAGRRRRALSVASAVLMTALAADLVNIHYGYFPTLGDLLQQRLPREVSLQEVVAHHDNSPQRNINRFTTSGGSRGHELGGQRIPKRHTELALADSTARSQAGAQGVDRAALPEKGKVVSMTIPAPRSGFVHRVEYVYLPPIWFSQPRPALPVIELITGTPGGTDGWIRAAHVVETTDAFARQHGGAAPILVMPDPNGSFAGDTECVDGPKGLAETYLSADVPAYFREVFGASADPAQWAVAGLSAGGTCSVHLALRHPDVYRHLADFSGDLRANLGSVPRTVRELYGGSTAEWEAHDPLTLLSQRRFNGMSAWFEVAYGDRAPRQAAERLAAAARRAGMDTRLVLREGDHNYPFWAACFRDALPWLAAKVGITH